MLARITALIVLCGLPWATASAQTATAAQRSPAALAALARAAAASNAAAATDVTLSGTATGALTAIQTQQSWSSQSRSQ